MKGKMNSKVQVMCMCLRSQLRYKDRRHTGCQTVGFRVGASGIASDIPVGNQLGATRGGVVSL